MWKSQEPTEAQRAYANRKNAHAEPEPMRNRRNSAKSQEPTEAPRAYANRRNPRKVAGGPENAHAESPETMRNRQNLRKPAETLCGRAKNHRKAVNFRRVTGKSQRIGAGR